MENLLKDENPRITEEEIAIIKKAQAGDESAFAWIFNRYKKFVDRILYGYIGDLDEARDLTNIVFLKVHRKLSKFATYDSFGGWLRILTNRVAIDYMRIKGNQRYMLGDNEDKVVDVDTVGYAEDDAVNHLQLSRIFEVLDNYPPHVKQIFTLHYLHNMPIDTVAKKLRLPLGTVKSVLSRTRQKLRNYFNKSNK